MRWGGLCLALAAAASSAEGAEVTSARYADPTARYAHGVLGDALEWGTLELTSDDGRTTRLVLPEVRVFEDLAPRLHDIDGDGVPEAVVIESHQDKGARLAVYGLEGLITATPYIGRSYRWLAPVGVGDLDGDGAVELAYVDRPHLAKTLRVWRYADGALAEIASLPGVTNHRIGQDFISGGLRDCGKGPEMIVASGNWQEVLSITLRGGQLTPQNLGPFEGPASWAAALACAN